MGGLNKEIAQLELQISFYIDEVNKLKAKNEELTEQLRIGGVSQQRELLIAYNVEFYKGLHDVTLKQIEGHVDGYLSNL